MAKIAVLGDSHFGMRNDNKRILEFQCKFYEEQFFPYLEKNGITEIIQTGDFFDNRKYIAMPTLAAARKYFIDPCIEKNIKVKVIAGNHDLPYRYNNSCSSVKQLLEDIENFQIFENEIHEDEHGIKYYPWISPSNKEEFLKDLKKGGSICVGHFETSSFLMEGGHLCDKGTTELKDFKKFDLVISGHFHHRSKNKNLNYVGVPYEMSFNDCEQIKGFHILDTETKKMEFIPNEEKLFFSYNINSEKETDISNLKENSFVRMRILENNNPHETGKLISKINFLDPYDFKIIDKTIEKYSSNNVEEILNLKSTEDLIVEYVNEIAEDHKMKDEISETCLLIHEMAKERQQELQK